MNLKNNTYYVLFLYKILPVLVYRIIPTIIIMLSYIYITSDVWLCDDTPSGTVWGGELAGTPQHSYEPYRPGLQQTSQGYRYEMDGNNNYPRYEMEGDNNYPRYEMDGNNSKHHHPYGPNSYDNNRYYESQSTQLGVIEPTRSEFERNGYSLEPEFGFGKTIPWGKPSLRKSVWKYIKNDIKKTHEKVEARRAKVQYQNEHGDSGYWLRQARHAERQELRNREVAKYDQLRKVRRFD